MNKEDQIQKPTSQDNMEIDESFPASKIESISHNIVNSDPKTITDKLSKYDKLDTEERHTLVKNLAVMLDQVGPDGVSIMKSLLYQIIKDREDIAQTLLQKFGQLCKYLEKQEKFEENIKNLLIPILNEYLKFNQLDIKQLAGKQLGILAHKLNDKDRGDYVLRHVIEMAHDDNNEDNRIVAVQLFSSMSQCFGKQLCEQFIGLQILSLGEDISFKVRKEAIKHLPIISRLVSRQFFIRLLNFFQSKSKDSSNWAIRKACVDVIIEMTELCTKEEREGHLTEILLTLLKDTNKWVRISAYKSLGKFIYELKGLKFNEKLLFQFCRMTENQINSLGKQNQIIYSCAYNFPAVLDSLGANRWEPDLCKVYEKLLKQPDKRIKQTMSESLHEVAKIIGEANTEKYLFKVVDTFFKDKNDDIKLGMIRHMAEIMHVLSEEKRESLIGVFEELQKDQKKWRIRECIGKQLGKILQIYQPQTIFQYVVPILLKFCSDSVSIVREEAAGKVGDFIEKLSSDAGLLVGLIQSVKAFGTSPKYTQRQAFLIMCQKLMEKKQLFQEHFLQILIGLASDKVVNVKLVLAETVKKHIESKGCLANEASFLKLKEQLSNDENEEVKAVFQEE